MHVGRVVAAVVLVLAAAATLGTSALHTRVNVVYPGSMDCQRGCEFLAGGWPFPYLVDHPGISPAGSISLVEGIMGVDIIRPLPLLASFVFWAILFGVIAAIVLRQRTKWA